MELHLRPQQSCSNRPGNSRFRNRGNSQLARRGKEQPGPGKETDSDGIIVAILATALIQGGGPIILKLEKYQVNLLAQNILGGIF